MSTAHPSGWDAVLVTEALDEDRPIIRPTVKTAARDYRDHGAFPIVDQSQNAIAGWTDNASAVLRPSRPVVVFGDHTRAFKYVDFPFATGADGTLVLNPSREFEPLFFYFACLGLEIPARGYNRHYTMLREMPVPKPPLGEQRKIAAVLGKVQAAVAVEGDLVRVARELKQAALRQLFIRGLRGEPSKQTLLGLVPESWQVMRLEELCNFFNGNAFESKDYVPDGLINFRVVNIREAGRVDIETDKKFLPREFGIKFQRYLLEKDDILLVMVGATRGKLCMIREAHLPALMNQNMWRVTPKTAGLDARYLYYYLSILIPHYMAKCSQDARGFFKKEEVRDEPLLVPSPAEQREIAALLSRLDAKIVHHEARQALLQELFRTLLHDLLTARRRVTGLVLTA